MLDNENAVLKEIHRLDKNFAVKIAQLETKLDENVNERFTNSDRRISKLEDNQRWVVLAIMGAFLTAILSNVIK